MRRAITAWESVSRHDLQLPSAAPPWMIFFDGTCAWDVGAPPSPPTTRAPAPVALRWQGRLLPMRAAPHEGTVRLPDGSGWPAHENVARASFYSGTSRTYFIVATPEGWRRDPAWALDPTLDDFFLGVTLHELTHTRHLPLVIGRLKAIVAQAGQTDVVFDDDLVQNTFEGDQEFRTAFEKEVAVFFAAADAPTREARRVLIRQGLDLVRARRAKHFTASRSHFGDLEDVFLALEGAGQWASYRYARRTRSRTEALSLVRDRRRYWSQEEGLALFLLLDLEVRGWQRAVFSGEAPGPFTLLERAIQ